MRIPGTTSLRARILILVLVVGLAPLAGLGFWLSGRTARTGEAVLRERLRDALAEDRATIEREWVPYRSRLLDLADIPPVAAAMADGAMAGAPPAALMDAVEAMDLSLESVRMETASGAWVVDRGPRSPSAFGLPLQVRIPLYDRLSGDSLGTLQAAVNINVLRARATAPMAGAIFTALDPSTGTVLIPVGIDRNALDTSTFLWQGESWVVERMDGVEPPVRLLAAAPLAPFASPFEDAGRRGLGALAAVVLLGLVLAWLLSRRLTASLQQLADGAAAVAAGDLSRTVPISDDEVGRVGTAFNTMTQNLRATLAQLADRESLTAVNEFAAALAHEVRNPLTSIQLDLQEVEERLPHDSPLRPIQAQALADLRRLDRTVGGALETARSGRVDPRTVDIIGVLATAGRAATPTFRGCGATLELPADDRTALVRGDPDALERVFLNLFMNAAQATGQGGAVAVAMKFGDDAITITVSDDGPGIPPDHAELVFDAFFTTRAGGTGVGLAIARRIITAHHGTIEVTGTRGQGATFQVTLPMLGVDRVTAL